MTPVIKSFSLKHDAERYGFCLAVIAPYWTVLNLLYELRFVRWVADVMALVLMLSFAFVSLNSLDESDDVDEAEDAETDCF